MPAAIPQSRLAAAALLGLALLVVPAPLVPPHWLAEHVQMALGVGWKGAYLASAIGLQGVFYGSLGVLAALLLKPAAKLSQRMLQIAVTPLVVAGIALVLRGLKLGHLPMAANAVVPVTACFLGVALGLGLLYRRLNYALPITGCVLALALWGLLGRATSVLGRDTEASLRSLLQAGRLAGAGDVRFGALLQASFAPSQSPASGTLVQQNRGAIMALGIALGHERLSRFVGLDQQSDLVRSAASLRAGTALRGREDWARHYTLSAALAVLGHPFISDAGGLVKEQLDFLSGGSGFSFGDLAADRAGVRFAAAATRSDPDAKSMRDRIRAGFAVDHFFPLIADLPENLTVAQFRERYGAAGSEPYREQVAEIERRIDRCAALSSSNRVQ